MQDQKTILPAAVLVTLFKDTLVLPEKEIKSVENEEKEIITAIGKEAIATTTANEVLNELKSTNKVANFLPKNELSDFICKTIMSKKFRKFSYIILYKI